MNAIPRDERTVSDFDFLMALDPKRKDLAPIRRAGETGDLDAARRMLVDHFRTRRHPRWFFDLRDGSRGRIASAWSGTEMENRRHADALLRNAFMMREDEPGRIWNFGPRLRWRTPEMRQLASTAYRFKRHVFMRDLAVAYAETGRPVYARKFAEFARRWREDWPLVVEEAFHPDTAVLNRSDGHDTMTSAFRWMAWMDCLYGGIALAPEVPTETAFGLIKGMWFIAIQYRHYEKSAYAPANHHLFERGTSPFLFGVMIPEFPEVARLVGQARPVIARHVTRSFLADGGYEERTVAYTISALQMFLIPMRLGLLNRVPLLREGEKSLIRRCGEMAARIALPDGSLPDVGDGMAGAERTGDLLGSVAALTNSRIAADVVRRLRLGARVKPEDRSALKAVKLNRLPLTVHYPDSGYFVARDSWSPRASAMAMSVPGPGISNHAHDDALSLQLVVRGEPMLGMPMSALYSYLHRNLRAKKCRSLGHFYAMTSHNVVLAGGEPLRSVASLTPTWGVTPTPVKTEWVEMEGGIRVTSAHEGYPGMRLSREVVFRHRKEWIVRDRVEGGTGKPHVARWHFEYGVEVVADGDAFWAARGNTRLRISISSGSRMKPRLYRDNRWLKRNPMRPGETAPFVIDVKFGGAGDDLLETRFEIMEIRA